MNERKIGCTLCGAGYLEALGPFLMRCDFCSALSAPPDGAGQPLTLVSAIRTPSAESDGALTTTAAGVERTPASGRSASEPAPAPLPYSTALLTLQLRAAR